MKLIFKTHYRFLKICTLKPTPPNSILTIIFVEVIVAKTDFMAVVEAREESPKAEVVANISSNPISCVIIARNKGIHLMNPRRGRSG